MNSPYTGLPVEAWRSKTLELVTKHPLPHTVLFGIVQKAWTDIFASQIGSKPFLIGKDIFPAPQIMGFLLHELIALELTYQYPGVWRRDQNTNEKDLVYIPDELFSIEIKTSSNLRHIYGNRSYTMASQTNKKSKSGYYLAVNFPKFASGDPLPLTLIRFGWLDHEDWLGQAAASGQQARLLPAAEANKLLPLPF